MDREASFSLVPILAIQLIGTLGYSITIPLLVFLVTDLGGASWTYGLVGATYSAFQLVGAPLLGRWSDTVGRRRVLMISQAGTFAAWLLFLLALALPKIPVTAVWGATLTVPLLVVFASRAIDGLTGGNISVASAYVADVTVDAPQRRQAAFGQMGMAASVGFAIGPALAGMLGATAWGYVLPIATAALISGVATLLCAVWLPEPRRPCPQGPPPAPTVTRVMGQEHRRCDREPPTVEPGVLRQPQVAAMVGATFIMFLGFNLFYASFPVHADRAMHWQPAQMGLFFAVTSGTMIAAQGPILRVVSARLAPPWVFGLGMLGLVVSFAAFASTEPLATYAGAVAFALGNGLAWPTFQARLADLGRDETQGAIQGAATSAGSVASILGLVVGGALYPVLGARVFMLGAGLFAIVAALTRVWFRDARA